MLIAGFGGLLLLMIVAGVDALMVFHQSRTTNAELRSDFLARGRALENIRNGIYLSGTLARDYLMAPLPAEALAQRSKLLETERQTDAALEQYSRTLGVAEAESFRSLLAEIHTYWRVLDFMLEPDHAQQHRNSSYFYNQLLSRRAAMLTLADDIAKRNEEDVTNGDEKLARMFDDFRFRLLLILAVTLAGGLALAGTTSAHLLRAQGNLNQLSSRLVSAQEEERRSISRELHDEVGQSLTALAMEAGAAANSPEAPEELRRRLESIRQLAEHSINAVRNMALLLRPSMLDDLGLVPALQWQAREVTQRTGVKVRVSAQGLTEDLPDEHKTCVYRVVQEALNNSVRHAQARGVRIEVTGQDRAIQVLVQDDGQGFDPSQCQGLGLLGMAERVRHAGGEIDLDAGPGRGTTVRVKLPLPRNLTA